MEFKGKLWNFIFLDLEVNEPQCNVIESNEHPWRLNIQREVVEFQLSFNVIKSNERH